MMIPMLLAILAAGTQQTPSFNVRVENKLTVVRENETVALPWTTVTRELRNASASSVRVRE
ncbi:MAG TPA: hypothetical protein VFZ04_12600, partial [Longimicrobiales bacterium]